MQTHIQAAYDYMSNVHAQDTTGHDIAHVKRVHKLAQSLAKAYPEANHYVIEMAALLHDTVDDKLVNPDDAYRTLNAFLDDLGVTTEYQDAIRYIIQHMSFRQTHHVGKLQTIEAQIVQDADRLDALGAIGIARTFQFAGHFKEPMWTSEATYEVLRTHSIALDTLSPSAIKHFYEKLLLLKDLMNTPEAQELALQRHQFLEQFLDQFFAEWDIAEQ
ncbi:phosphohydrolase [Staphylococcus microti]|uniref:HD domain-containing protein n=1 Tax=Staphylococcus microti TaxID=569857 RepID=A0A0D6XRE7_9STAP|nr:HD domain-containing protein [Staphylococcus microti]KIX91369.1 phosphohydrolase [Staphylococcus microti]PNZ75957.1 HD domain-containing protein [Staphylococcus microti]SUM58032.1 HD domain-containing protein [Staphylococcus microti]